MFAIPVVSPVHCVDRGRPESEHVPAMAGQIARSFNRRFQAAGFVFRLQIVRAIERDPFAKVFAHACVQA
ncbi:MAG: hypothetical protein ABSA13_08785 [Beijerinckiaceae bacterium]|jgi:hypothetical protein